MPIRCDLDKSLASVRIGRFFHSFDLAYLSGVLSIKNSASERGVLPLIDPIAQMDRAPVS